MKLQGYEPLKSWCVPVYWYEDGKEHEEYWVDSQNLLYYKFLEDLEDLGVIDEEGRPIKNEDGTEREDPRKWWIIEPVKPTGTTLTKDNQDELIKWAVQESYHGDDRYLGWEWDFREHKPRDYEENRDLPEV